MNNSQALSAAQLDRAVGVLLASAAGDALGAGYEFGPTQPELTPDMIGGGLGGFAPGEWTDDTDMSIGVAIAAATGVDLRSPEGLDQVAKQFRRWHQSQPADIGMQTAQVLGSAREATAAGLAAAAEAFHHRNGRSAGNGSLMRTGPVAIAYLDDPFAIVDAAMKVSALTHYETVAQEACAVWCLIIRHAVLVGEFPQFSDIAQWVPSPTYWQEVFAQAEENHPFNFTQNGWAVGALQAAWSAITHTPVPNTGYPSEHLREALYTAIRIGHDTDTVAAIAGQVLGARWGASAVPANWRRLLHGWPDSNDTTLEALATLIARKGSPCANGWPSADRVDRGQWGAPFIVQHPHSTNLFMGTASSLDILPEDIDVVVSLCLTGKLDVGERKQITFRLIDTPAPEANPNIDFVLDDIGKLLHRLCVTEGKKVYLHCVRSEARTPAAAMAFSLHLGFSLAEAVQHVFSVIPQARRNNPFMESLSRIADSLSQGKESAPRVS